MAAVASNNVQEGLRGLDQDQFSESNPSRFTAVNGQGSPVANGHETSIGPMDDAASRSNPAVLRRQPSPPNTAANHSRTPSQQQENNDSAKRKRSYPDPEETRSTHPYHAHGFPTDHREPSILSPRMDMRQHNGRMEHDERNGRSSDPYMRASNGPMGYEQARPQPLSSDYDPHALPSQPYFTHPSDNADVRLAEALQRGTQISHPSQMRPDFVSPDEDEAHHQHEYGQYPSSTNRNSISGPDGDRKRRKRVFSNRTKTGCLTCRKRKKKCDEAHPECNNCMRGGFVCEGYTSRNTWQKPAPSKGPIPLQSKTGYGEPTRGQSQYDSEVSPDFMGGPPPPQRMNMSTDGNQSKPILVDEGQKSYHPMSSPDINRTQSGWPKQQRQIPSRSYEGHSSSMSKYQPDLDYRPFSAAPEATNDIPDPTVAPPHPGSASSRTHTSAYSSNSSAPSSHTAPAVAQAALQHTPSSHRPSSHHRHELTEREKMLRGEHFNAYTPSLMEDRERCSAAVWHFNNSSNPATGIKPEERMRFFKAIIERQPISEPSSESQNLDSNYPPLGSVGTGVRVEAPFHCDYGYNITIGNDVVIGRDCSITDACAVTIGNNSVLSPRVSIVCINYAVDPKERKRAVGRALGRAIVIENDCWIGAGATITPGIKVGRCSVVGAGAVICRDVPPYTVVIGNPQRVLRGIYEDNTDRT